MGRLKDKVAIITGGAQGMGASHARRFIAEGASVLLTDVKVEEGEALSAELGPDARFLCHDVTSSADWEEAVEMAEAAFGPVSILVNNAGIGPTGSIETVTEEIYRRCIEVNQLGVFLGIKLVAPSMARAGGGSIVNISSAGGIIGIRDGIEYVASKFAVRGMTKAAALELADRKIRVNSVHPGVIRTPMMSDENAALFQPFIPLSRMGEASDVTSLVTFLASDEADYCTGAEFVIDGGMTAQ